MEVNGEGTLELFHFSTGLMKTQPVSDVAVRTREEDRLSMCVAYVRPVSLVA